MLPQSDEKEALRVLKLAVEFMQWKTFEGGRRERFDAGLPLKRDRMYHYDDGKIDIAFDINPGPHRLDTYIRVHIVRGSLFRKREVVFDAENNDVKVFRPGHWVDYLTDLADSAKVERQQTEERERQQREEAARHAEEQRRKSFTPVDDSAVFKK